MESYKELLDFGKEYLRKKKIENGDLDAWLLMEYVCKITRTWYFIHEEDKVKEEEDGIYRKFIE